MRKGHNGGVEKAKVVVAVWVTELIGDVVALEMLWLICSALDFWGRGPGFEFGVSHNDPDALQDHCVVMSKNSG